MNKQEFMALLNATDDISAKKVGNIMTEYCDTTDDIEVLGCVETLDILHELQEYMKLTDYPEPYTIQDAFDALRLRIVYKYMESLKE